MVHVENLQINDYIKVEQGCGYESGFEHGIEVALVEE